ncbi:distal tail protein Dit [Bacillus phage Mgbh1]|uniref:Tail-like protein n=1 Tax=Bacillus phage Mgbh1 TaxID=1796993 RepID=A0A142F1N1_9CAUD|nr:distal tail protein Dit [Bacillus phage Mgbh1]AMQ66688.1 tail-like protein [Bacillus phage Mgbh1]
MSFRDFGEGGEVIRPSLQTIFNNVNIDEVLTDSDGSFTTISVSGRALAQTQTTILNPTHKHGGFYQQSRLEPRIITVRYKISAKTNEKFRQMFNRLNRILAEEEKRIEFTDENAFFVGSYYEAEDFDENSNVIVSSFSFICADPYKYDKVVYQTTFQDDVAVLPNDGTADCEPIFEMEVLQPTTFAMVSDESRYQMIGRPAEDNVEVVDTKNLILREEGDTIGQWQTGPVRVDPISGNISGTMGYDGTGIIATNYGTASGGESGHGPAIIREIPPIQDFEISTHIDTRTDLKEENFRAELYMFDESLKMLGKIGVRDGSRDFHRRSALGRVGEFVDNRTRYILGFRNYQHDDFGKSSMFNIRVRRVGNTYSFYIAQVVNGRHRNRAEGLYVDTSGEWMGKLRYIQLYIRTWAGRRKPYLVRFNNVLVHELIEETVDQTPYIAYPGDLITFDHEQKRMMINGEDRTDIKDFGGSYFTLNEGNNTLVVLPEDTFNTTVRWRERYR